MRNLIVLVIIATAGLVAYNYFTTGEFKLIPSSSLSDEEQELDDLVNQFLETQSEYMEGSRGASIGGIDTQADLTGAMRKIEHIEGKIRALQARLEPGAAKEKAARILAQIDVFKKAHQ
jgi:hypothetical protein